MLSSKNKQKTVLAKGCLTNLEDDDVCRGQSKVDALAGEVAIEWGGGRCKEEEE